jgi:hypothetical protein
MVLEWLKYRKNNCLKHLKNLVPKSMREKLVSKTLKPPKDLVRKASTSNLDTKKGETLVFQLNRVGQLIDV